MPNCHGKHNTTDNFLAKSSVRIEREILNAKNVCNEHGSASSVFTLHRVDDIERTKESEIAADGWELTKYLNFLKARALLENQKKKKKLQNRSYFNLLNSSLCMYISNNRLSKAWRKHCWHVGEQRTWRNWKHRTWTIVLFDYNVSISVCKTCMLFPYLWPIIFKISINYTNKNYHHCKPYVIIIVLPLDESD